MPCTSNTERCEKTHDKTPVPQCCRSKLQELLLKVTGLLTENEIKYWLDYGTLLGAVRDNEFIPWDDDADISILAEDKTKAEKVLQSSTLLKNHKVFTNGFNMFQVHYSETNSLHVDIFLWYEDGELLRRKKYIGMDKPKGTDVRKGRDFPKKWVDKTELITLAGDEFSVPHNPKHFCEFRYGKAWEVPMTIREWNTTDPKRNLTITVDGSN